MDRNPKWFCDALKHLVALRKESVDRNKKKAVAHKAFDAVALRKESVDRNVALDVALVPVEQVALRKESVDRNV